MLIIITHIHYYLVVQLDAMEESARTLITHLIGEEHRQYGDKNVEDSGIALSLRMR
jgi:hypothetical protein